MKKIYSALVVLLLMIITISCNNNNNQEILKITSDSTLSLTKLNLESLNDKLPKDELEKENNLDKFSKKEKEQIKLLINAKDNGINIGKSLYIMIDEVKRDYVISAIFWLDNEKKFQENFSKITDSKIVINTKKNLVYADNNVIGAIKGDMIVLSQFSNHKSLMNSFSVEKKKETNAKFYTDFWNRKAIENTIKIDQINKSLVHSADVSTWLNIEGAISSATNGYIETLAINRLLIDAGLSMNLNFEKGKVVLNTNTYLNEDLRKLVEKHYDGKKINYDILENVSVDNATTYALGYFSLDFIKHFVKEAGFESTVNNYLEFKDLTFDELASTFTGDYAFINNKVTEDKNATNQNLYSLMKSQQNSVFVLGINGKKSNKVIDIIKKELSASNGGHIFTNDNLLVFSTEEENLKLLKSNKKADNDNLEKVSNVNSYSWTSGEEFNKDLDKSEMKFKVENMISTSKMDNGNFSTEFTITIDKDSDNIIHYLMGYE